MFALLFNDFLKDDLELTINWSGEEPYARHDNPLVISLKFWLDSKFHTQCLTLELFGGPAFSLFFCLKVCPLTRLSICVSASGSYNGMLLSALHAQKSMTGMKGFELACTCHRVTDWTGLWPECCLLWQFGCKPFKKEYLLKSKQLLFPVLLLIPWTLSAVSCLYGHNHVRT